MSCRPGNADIGEKERCRNNNKRIQFKKEEHFCEHFKRFRNGNIL